MKDNRNVVDRIYRLRSDFILVGLTGRTGSGCTTVARILATENVAKLKSETLRKNERKFTNEVRKQNLADSFMRKNWIPFHIITGSNVLVYLIIAELSKEQNPLESFIRCLNFGMVNKTESETKLQTTLEVNDGLRGYLENIIEAVNLCEEELISGSKDSVNCWNTVTEKITDFRKNFESCLNETQRAQLPQMMQNWGDALRKNGTIKSDAGKESKAYKLWEKFGPAVIAAKINEFIVWLRQNQATNGGLRVAIDCLRNPFEVLFFREQYSQFYLLSVNTTQKIRHEQLYRKGFRQTEIDAIDKRESGDKDIEDAFKFLNLDKCIELSDVHLAHDGTLVEENRNLITQIFTYIALMLHPGLVPPSPMERCMQLAYTAKLNSGCLSRQVGAVVTNNLYSVCSIGWNTVPAGQTPCSLRTLSDLCESEDESAFSEFEKAAHFKHIAERLHEEYRKTEGIMGIPLCYCFKDIYTATKEKERGNQVHTRSLHAEENAFLQLAKYGGQSTLGGFLFTTASCCELCAKKAYQLGIRRIYYVDLYPGISQEHIMHCGERQPEMVLFHGAVGRAYVNLYNPLLPLKDEISARSGVNVKDVLSGVINSSMKPSKLDHT